MSGPVDQKYTKGMYETKKTESRSNTYFFNLTVEWKIEGRLSFIDLAVNSFIVCLDAL